MEREHIERYSRIPLLSVSASEKLLGRLANASASVSEKLRGRRPPADDADGPPNDVAASSKAICKLRRGDSTEGGVWARTIELELCTSSGSHDSGASVTSLVSRRPMVVARRASGGRGREDDGRRMVNVALIAVREAVALDMVALDVASLGGALPGSFSPWLGRRLTERGRVREGGGDLDLKFES